jgi:hypothetical protein
MEALTTIGEVIVAAGAGFAVIVLGAALVQWRSR